MIAAAAAKSKMISAATPPRTTSSLLLLRGCEVKEKSLGNVCVSKLRFLTVVGVSPNAVVGSSLPSHPGGRDSPRGLPQFRQKFMSSAFSCKHEGHFFIIAASF